MIAKKEKVTENNAGYLYGKIGLSNLRISTQIVGPRITSRTVNNNPINPP